MTQDINLPCKYVQMHTRYINRIYFGHFWATALYVDDLGDDDPDVAVAVIECGCMAKLSVDTNAWWFNRTTGLCKLGKLDLVVGAFNTNFSPVYHLPSVPHGGQNKLLLSLCHLYLKFYCMSNLQLLHPCRPFLDYSMRTSLLLVPQTPKSSAGLAEVCRHQISLGS